MGACATPTVDAMLGSGARSPERDDLFRQLISALARAAAQELWRSAAAGAVPAAQP